ncbi:MAG: GTP-binding protein [Candidatus Helarchaeota archaeon]|nr:GTP-binding protein [Candidatus Helarchaeota archaeon]
MGLIYRCKLILFGSAAVGKTSIIDRYINNKFEEEYISTLGYNVFEKSIEMKDENTVNFMIFDIGGQEQFEELRKKYATGAKSALIVYDITNKDSFDNIKKWKKDLDNFTDNAIFILIGNKVDLEDARKIQKDKGDALAKEIGAVGFFETSAKTNIEIDNAFHKLAQMYLEKVLSK